MSATSFRTVFWAVCCVLVPLAAQPQQQQWLPVAIHSPGLNDTVWRTELVVLNSSCASANVDLTFHPGGGDPVLRSLTLAPGEQRVYPDVVQDLFGDGSISAQGPVEVSSDVPVTITSRTYNVGSNGTFGQGVGPALELQEGQFVYLARLRETEAFRTNIEFSNLGSGQTRVRVTLLDSSQEIGSYEHTLEPWSRLQDVRPYFYRFSRGDVDAGWARIEVLEGGPLSVLASVVDNETGDGTTVNGLSPVGSSSTDLWFLVVARNSGEAGSFWKTQLSLLNPGPTPGTATLDFLCPNGDLNATLDLAAGSQVLYDDLVQELFGLAEGQGPLRVVADIPLIVSARIYNQSPTGTFGQVSDAEPSAAGFSSGESVVVPILREDEHFRSNVDYLNMGSAQAELRVVLYPNGQSAAKAYDLILEPRERVREGRIFSLHGINADSSIGYAVVEILRGEHIHIFGSVIDDVTNDPTTIRAAPFLGATPWADFSFSPENPRVGEDVTFRDNSHCFPSVWSWDFGDGHSSSVPNPTHQYAAPGTYEVCLDVSNSAGVSEQACQSVQVASEVPPPTADFGVDPGIPLVGSRVRFLDFSSGGPTHWEWDFGDGARSTLQNPTHIYDDAGEYTVTLTVSNEGGRSQVSKTVSVKWVIASFDWEGAPVVGKPIHFVDDSRGGPLSWFWEFGDGSTSTVRNPVHTYDEPGPYEVTLTVENSNGLDSLTRLLDFVPEVDFLWTPESVHVGIPVGFSDVSTSSPLYWAWNFGDSADYHFEQDPTHTFEFAGKFTVTLRARNSAGTGWGAKSVPVQGTCRPPAAPQIFPLDGARSADANCPYFFVRWSATSPFSSYELQESTDPDFRVNVLSYLVEGRNESPALEHNATLDTTYYFRVRAREGAHCGEEEAWSDWSPVQTVVVGPDQPCQVWVVRVPGMDSPVEFVRVRPGSFLMGSPETEQGRASDETLHSVTINHELFVSRFEVTQRLWEAVLHENPSFFSDCEDCPVDSVSWFDICGSGSYCGERAGFVYEINRVMGLSSGSLRFRLPTEAEWEYAARAGTTSRFPYGEILPWSSAPRTAGCDDRCGGCPDHDENAWYCQNSLDGTHPVGRKLANPWGLYDILGGVSEWVWDWYGEYDTGDITNPVGPASGLYKVQRGGAWAYYSVFLRPAVRLGDSPGNANAAYGFRLVFGPELELANRSLAKGISTKPKAGVQLGPGLTTEFPESGVNRR